MISIVISSYREDYYNRLLNNIQKTFGGTEYEVVKIDNPGIMSISEAYNLGASKSIYNNLLFIHEDIEFLEYGWGTLLINFMETVNFGIIGLAGGIKKFKIPTGHDQGIKNQQHLYVRHHKDETFEKNSAQDLLPVKTLDGVFLAMTKLTWKKFKFNEEIKGFHFYDMDITLRTSEVLQNYVISSIPILHFSMGGFNDDWLKASIIFHKGNYNFDVASKKEKRLVKTFWLKRLLKEKISFKNRLKYLLNIGFEFKNLKAIINFILAKKVYE